MQLSKLPAMLAISLIGFYRATLSSLIGRQCRYLPSCSEYAQTAISRFGVWPGLWMGLARVQRCGPNGASGFEPVPETARAGAVWYLPWRYGYWRSDHIDPSLRLDL